MPRKFTVPVFIKPGVHAMICYICVYTLQLVIYNTSDLSKNKFPSIKM